MTDILQDLSPSTVPQVIDNSMIAYHTFFSTLPNAQLHEDPDLLWFETGVPLDLFNGVLQTHGASDTLATSIDHIVTHFQRRNLPFHWYVGPTSQPVNIGDVLVTHGILHVEDEPGMAVDLHALNEHLPTSSQLAIHPVTHHDQLTQWTRVWGCGAPDEVIPMVLSVYSQLPLSSQSPLQFFVGTLDDEPVATSALFLGAGVAAIHHIVTIPQMRRRGIGAAMTLFTAREARRQGYHIAVLTASPMGIGTYRRLGFREYCVYSTYQSL